MVSYSFDDTFTSQAALSCEPMVSPLNNNEIDFRISFDKSDDEDYTVIFDKNSFSYKIISVDNLKTDSENDNDKFNMPSFLLPELMVSCFDDLDYLKDFENEFSAIVYNDALTSKSDFLTEPTMCPQHVDEFLKDETSFSEYDEEEQNILYFNDLFPFNVIYLDDSKSNKDNDDKPSGDVSIIPLPDEINIDVGAYAQGSNKLLKTNMALPPRDQRHQYLRFKGLEYTDADITDFKDILGRIYGRGIHRVLVLDFKSLLVVMVEGLTSRMLMEHRDDQGQSVFTSRAWRRLIACSIAGRSQAPEKVTVTDLFYLRGMDVGSVNIPYLLARYLRMFASGRKRGAMISRGQFAWVAPRPERQHVAVAGTPEVIEDAHIVDVGALAVPALEDVHGLRGALGEQREVLDSMARDFSQFTTWTVTRLSWMIDQAGVRYTSYSDYQIPYQRRTRRRTDDANTSAPQQPDP
ncbi:hypothetical protein Tco_1144387 [Tanacetum coccineum]